MSQIFLCYNFLGKRVVFYKNVSPVSCEIWKEGGKMFQINDTVMYGMHGVCKIEDITTKEFMGIKKEYYVLKPVSDSAATLYVPVHNENLLGKMRKILSEQEVYHLIETMPQKETIWFQNENERKEQYKKLIAKGNHSELIGMIKAIYLQKQKRESEGKHLYISDERFFREAERILYDEFRYVLNIKKDDLLPLIFSKIQSENTY